MQTPFLFFVIFFRNVLSLRFEMSGQRFFLEAYLTYSNLMEPIPPAIFRPVLGLHTDRL